MLIDDSDEHNLDVSSTNEYLHLNPDSDVKDSKRPVKKVGGVLGVFTSCFCCVLLVIFVVIVLCGVGVGIYFAVDKYVVHGAGQTKESVFLGLNGNWTLTNANESISVVAIVPGTVQMALLDAKLIDDPNYGFNDVEYRWIAEETWTFHRTFEVNSDMKDSKKQFLILDGLDTVAHIFINGDRMTNYATDNMHRRFVLDVSPYVRKGGNSISVTFSNAIEYAQKQSEQYPYVVPTFDGPYFGEPHRNFIRKAQCHFGWDWGPAHFPVGIWKDVTLVSSDYAFLSNAMIKVTNVSTEDSGETWDGTLSLHTLLEVEQRAHFSVKISCRQTARSYETRHWLDPGSHVVKLNFMIHDVEMWWPLGYGNQKLYDFDVVITRLRWVFSNKQMHSMTRRVGFRTIELATPKVSDGEDFYFKVNGKEIFIKGSNWIPADSFQDRISDAYLSSLIQSAVDANFNLLRIWGGGIYQSDSFYDKCDETGIMVWQEFMFACSLYPRDSDFLADVREEVKDQVFRLGSHPSIVLWSANNENEGGLTWTKPSPELQDLRLYVVDYTVLYLDTIRNELIDLDVSRPFWPSSPTNGPISTDPYVLRFGDVQSEKYGDVHYYNYEDDCMDVTKFPSPRFASEYGWMSFPSLTTIKQASSSEDWSIDSAWMKHRQHHPNGTEQIIAQLNRWFTFPTGNDTLAVFDSFLYLSQVMQAMCIRSETEHYRIGMGLPQNTMGTIYWQHNDIWQAPSWASLEYGGRWKILHNFAKEFYSSVIITGFESPSDSLHVHVSADNSLEAAFTGTVTVTLYKWSDGSELNSFVSGNVQIVPGLSKEYFSGSISEMLNGTARSEVVLVMTLSSGATLATNVLYLNSFSEVSLQDPSLSVIDVRRHNQSDHTSCDVVLKTESIAPFVWLESSIAGHFEDNGFLFLTVGGGQKTIRFKGNSVFDIDEFQTDLKIRSLYDTLSN